METTTTITMTAAEVIGGDTDCPLPLSVIPNSMGINLCSVSTVSWSRRDDGQITELVLRFSPEE